MLGVAFYTKFAIKTSNLCNFTNFCPLNA